MRPPASPLRPPAGRRRHRRPSPARRRGRARSRGRGATSRAPARPARRHGPCPSPGSRPAGGGPRRGPGPVMRRGSRLGPAPVPRSNHKRVRGRRRWSPGSRRAASLRRNSQAPGPDPPSPPARRRCPPWARGCADRPPRRGRRSRPRPGYRPARARHGRRRSAPRSCAGKRRASERCAPKRPMAFRHKRPRLDKPGRSCASAGADKQAASAAAPAKAGPQDPGNG